MTPIPVGPSKWDFAAPELWVPYDCLGPGGDLEPATLVSAYQHGVFPMPDGETQEIYWWSPMRRGVLVPEKLRISRSLRQSRRKYRTTIDTAFKDVVAACANPERPGGWINDEIQRAYETLHELGWAHSVETWNADGQLVGGLYGVAIGGLFAGESMFHTQRDASKVALVALAELFSDEHPRLIDIQWRTDHLTSLGAEEWHRAKYLARLPEYVQGTPLVAIWA